jgi:hypothetical protein
MASLKLAIFVWHTPSKKPRAAVQITNYGSISASTADEVEINNGPKDEGTVGCSHGFGLDSIAVVTRGEPDGINRAGAAKIGFGSCATKNAGT